MYKIGPWIDGTAECMCACERGRGGHFMQQGDIFRCPGGGGGGGT